jgi:hypothetical protein
MTTSFYVRLNHSATGTTKKYRINLRYVDPEPVHDRYIAWRLLAASSIGLCLTALFICIRYYTRFSSDYLLVTASLLAAASLITLLLFFYKSYDAFIYGSSPNRVGRLT